MKKGDFIRYPMDTEHWHTSTMHSKVSYIAIYENSPTEWTEKLTRVYYNSVAKKLDGN